MKRKHFIIALMAMLSCFAFTAKAQTSISSLDDLKAALASTTNILVDGEIVVDEEITIPAGTTVGGDGTLLVRTMVYVVSTENPYPGVSYNKTATKNGSISGTVGCNVAYEISLDGGETWFDDTTNGKAQAVTVKEDGTKSVSTSFQTAFTSAKSGEIVHMLKDAHVQSTNSKKNNGPLRSYYGLILEGNGHTIYTDLESSGASNEYATIKFTSYLAGTGADVRPVLKNVTINSQNNSKADLDLVSGDVTFTVSLYNVNLLGKCQYASFSWTTPSAIINKSNVKLYDCTIPSWDAGSAKLIEFYSGDYSLSFNPKCKVYGGTFSKTPSSYLADCAQVKQENGKYVVSYKAAEVKVEVTPSEEFTSNATEEEKAVANELAANTAVSNETLTLPVGVSNFTVQLTDIEATAEATTKVTFNVEPKNASGQKVSNPSDEITFRLPVPAAWSGNANVYHEGTLLGAYTIKEESGAKYVEVSSSSFSEFSVEAIVPLFAGEGTEVSPYIIDSSDKLAALRNEVNGGEAYEGVYFKLTSDITLSGEWTAIGNGSRNGTGYTGNAFKGVFDGGNNTISGLTITSTTGAKAAIGLFGVVDGGTVKNLNLTDVNINVASSDLAGAAIGMMLNGATADAITVSGAVVGHDGVGGIVGRLIIDGTIANCTNNASVTSNYGGIGGIVGKAYYDNASNTSIFATIENCTNKGTITAPQYVGGIAGLARANVTGCVNEGEIVGGTHTGGIIGQLIAAGTVSGNENKVKVSGTAQVGGIIGSYSQTTDYHYNNVTIANNINRGEIAATQQYAAILGVNNIDGFTAMTATGNQSFYYVEGLELFGNPEDMVIDATNKFILPTVAIVNGQEFSSFTDALEATKTMTGDVTVELYDKVTFNQPLIGNYTSINFVGKAENAEMYLDVQGYTTATGKKVSFTDLKLSKSEGGFIANAGFMNVAFGIYDVVEVTYNNCTFENGACASSGKVTFNGCTFKKSWDKYGLWAYGNVDVTVQGSTFADYRGIKMYAENGAAESVEKANLTVKNTNFSAVDNKPAIVLTYGESVVLEGNTYSSTGTFELDLDGKPNGVAVTSDVAPVCKNDNGACGVLVDGKIYTTVAQAAEVATSGSTVTLLHNSAETVALPMGVTLNKNNFEAAGVTVAGPVAKIGDVEYATLAEAITAAQNGETITLIDNVVLAERVTIPADKTLTIDLNGKSISMEESIIATAYAINNLGNLTITDGVGGGSINARGIYNGYGDGGANVATAKITVVNGTINAKGTNGGAAIFNYGTAEVKGGTFTSIGGYSLNNQTGAKMTIAAGVTANNGIYASGATLVVNGGEINGNRSGCHVLYAWNSVVTINGGTFYNYNSGNSTIMAAGTTKLTIKDGTFGIKDGRVPGDGNTWTSCLTDTQNSAEMTVNGGTFNGGFRVQAGTSMTINGGSFNDVYGSNYNIYGTVTVTGGTFTDDTAKTFASKHIAAGYELGANGTVAAKPVAEVNGVKYASFAEAAAAAQADSEIKLLANIDGDITVPANVTLNGNGFAVSGAITADGTITFAGVTKAGNFGVKNVNTVVNIPAGASLQLTGTGRMVIGHGCTFNITGTIADAKTANVADLTPSLVMPGASFTGAGVTFNVTNAYISAPSSYCSSSKSASGTFDFNITNSIWENAGKFAFESQSTAATVNFDLVNSVLNTGSHLVFGVSRGEVVIDNSNVNVGKSNQIENQSTMTIKNGSVVNGAVATSSNAKNPGTIIVENATYAVTGEFSGSDLGTGTLIIKNGANVSVGSIKAGANVTVDAEGMAAGDEINFTANLSQFTGTLSVINNDKLEASIVNGKVVLAAKPVAKIGETPYTTLEAAFAAATEGQTITMLVDATPALTSQRAITKAAVIDLGGKTMTLTEDDLYFGTTTFKNGTIVVDPSVKPSTAVFWMFANQTLTFDNVKVVATGVTGTYLIGLEGENSDLNLLNGSEILVENTTALDLDIICVNGTNTCDIKVENSKVNVTNLDGRVFFRGNYTVKDSEVNLAGITKAGFRIEAGQTLSIEGTSVVNIEGEPRDGGIHMTDASANYTKAETATVNATVNEPKVAKVGENTYRTLAQAVAAVEDGGTITLIANETFTKNNRYNNGGWWDGLGYSGDKSFTIDLANFTISQDGALNDYLMWFKNDGAKGNTITLKNGTLDAGTTAYCALATASSNVQKITVNLENIQLINNNSNGATLKIRGGAELNAKAGTIITGKNSYVGIEAVGKTTVVNIYEGAEIYQNGTSSYCGCLAGASGNSTINVYGGKGQSKSGGFIAMTSGGTINIEGGEWTANTDGTYANGNKSVLVAQSDKQYNAGAGNSIVNVTGGTFKGGYNCYGNKAGDAQINISGGNFNANPTSYVAENYVAVENNGVWNVVKAAAKIGTTAYATFAGALAAAQAGDAIELLADVNADAVILLGKSLTINGNGHKVTSNATRVFRVTTANTEVTLNDVNMVSRTVMVYPNDIRGISIDAGLQNVELTLNNCSVDFTDATACDWAYAVNVSGNGTGHTVTVNGGTYEGANVINVHGANNTVVVKDATLTSLYPNNDQYYGACIWVLQNQGSSVEATGNTFNGSNALTFNLGTGTTLTESNNTDNTKYVVAKIGAEYYTSLADAFAAGGEVKVLQNIVLAETAIVPAGKVVTLDLNGKTISQTKECTASYEMICNKGNLTITGNGKISFTDTSAGDPNFGWGSYTVRNEGNLVVENGTIEHLGTQTFGTHCIMALYQYAGSTTINGGTISTPNYRSARLWKGNMTINGGTFDGQVWAQAVDNSANLVINGGTFEPNGNDASAVFVTNNQYDVQFAVTDGTFNGKVGCSDATKLAGAITGGKFNETAKNSTNSALIAEHYLFGEADANGYYGVIADPGYIAELTIVDGAYTEFVNDTEKTVGKLTYQREFVNINTWQAFYVPFEIELTPDFLDKYDVAYFNDIRCQDEDFDGQPDDDMVMEAFMLKKGKLRANYPYLIRPKTEEALSMNLELYDVVLSKTTETTVTCTSVFMRFELTGVYASKTIVNGDGQYAFTKDGVWKYANTTATIKPFRLILKITSVDGKPYVVSETANIRIRIEGEGDATDIEGVEFGGDDSELKYFDLMGRPVVTPIKGRIYIVNGKKVLY